MSNITQVVADVPVDDLDKTIPTYQELSGAEDVHRFGYQGLEVAFVGSLSRAGAEILGGPAAVPTGLRVQARHPDGAVFEYLQTS